MTGSVVDQTNARASETERSTTSRLNRATLAMGAGTLLSRISGFARLAALGYALGVKNPLADGYNVANTTPNMMFDLLIGGVLAATVVPVFVSRLASRRENEAWNDISAVLTVSAVILVLGTVAVVLLAPQIIGLYTAGTTASYVASQRAAGTFLLRLFAPQIALYGLIALVTAVLNARRRFAAPMFVPIANNLVVIGVLLAVHAQYPEPNVVDAAHNPALLILLGVGTTGGVLVQALLLLPSLARAAPLLPRRGPDAGQAPPAWSPATGPRGSWDRLEYMGKLATRHSRRALRWRWEPGNEAVGRIVRLSGWTFGYALANQVALFIVLHLALVYGEGGASAYNYAYTFFSLPFGVVAVSVLSAVQPELARHWTHRNLAAFGRRTVAGLRTTVVAVIPPAVGFVVLAVPICALVLANGAGTVAGARETASVLVAMAPGLPGFCAYLFLCSGFQAMQDTRTVFFLYLIENAVNVVAAYLLEPFLGVAGLGWALSIAYTAAALITGPLLHHRLQRESAVGNGPDQTAVAPATVSDTGQLYLEVPAPDRAGLFSLAPMTDPEASPAPLSLGLGRAFLRVGVLSAAMAAALVAVTHFVGSDDGLGALTRVVVGVAVGVSVFTAGTAVAARWSQRRADGSGPGSGTDAVEPEGQGA